MDTTLMKKDYDTSGLQHGETWYAWIARGNCIRMVDLRDGKPHTRKYDNTGRNIETTDSSIGYILSPGTKDGRDEQHAIWHLVRCLAVFGHGRVPVTETSHSLRTALDAEIAYCREIGLPHRPIADYKRALDDFMDVAYYVQTPYLKPEEFASALKEKAQVLIDARYALSVAADEENASSRPATKEDVSLAALTIVNKIAESKSEVVTKVEEARPRRGRPAEVLYQRRGYNETEMMKRQRDEVVQYLEVELHKRVVDITPSDVVRVWNRAENREIWDVASKRKDASRGYKNVMTLYYAIKNAARKVLKNRN